VLRLPDSGQNMCGDPAASPELEGQNNVIKLHGSFNWRTADGRNALVVGTAKTGQIAALKLLAWYHDIFRRVLRAGELRLLIVGYGFAGEHINEVIADAAQNHGLKVLSWDVGANLRERVRAAPHDAAIWDACSARHRDR